jgi:hypothetical protein
MTEATAFNIHPTGPGTSAALPTEEKPEHDCRTRPTSSHLHPTSYLDKRIVSIHFGKDDLMNNLTSLIDTGKA